MSMIEAPMPYRYYETILAIINGLVDSAFTACRYAVQPNEPTELYYDRRSLTAAIIHETYSQALSKALESIVTSPENPTELQLEAGVGKLDWNNDYNEPYEDALELFIQTIHDISKNLAVAAEELDVNEIKKFFNSIKENTTTKG